MGLKDSWAEHIAIAGLQPALAALAGKSNDAIALELRMSRTRLEALSDQQKRRQTELSPIKVADLIAKREAEGTWKPRQILEMTEQVVAALLGKHKKM